MKNYSLPNLFYVFIVLVLPVVLLDLRLPVPNLEVRISDFYLILLSLSVLFFVHRSGYWFLGKLKYYIPFLVYATSILLFTKSYESMFEIVQWVLVLLWVPCMTLYLRGRELRLIKLLTIFLFFVTSYVVIYHISEGDWYRYKSLGDAKYSFGIFFLVSMVSFCFYKDRLFLFFLVISIAFLAFSLERKGILVGSLSVLCFLLMRYSRFFKAYPQIVLLSVMLVSYFSAFLIFFFTIQGDYEVIYFLDEERAKWESNYHRANLLANGLTIFYDHFWFGVGAGNMPVYMQEFYSLSNTLSHYTHNWYLDFFIEYGFIGFSLFFSYPFYLILHIKIASRRSLVLLPLAVYCILVPAFMANGTTTMIIVLTGLALLQHLYVMNFKTKS